MKQYINMLIKSSLETNRNMRKINESLKYILKESPSKYAKYGEKFLKTINNDVEERNKVIEELKVLKSQDKFNRIFELMYKLKNLDYMDNVSCKSFFSMYINSMAIGKFIE
ncbi:hypothetical protein [Clostridium felsineum]|uniref:Uncharacterized protein n=1 Tax=Clostridium felsineum TaxID=36839 RepID=A0A1S8LRJ6_9CLOT|nr:hypothetical protein [Clostridium felsineum]URZ05873.1 hypothetical protein CLROS_012050 [Clostridium felsineum]URZ10910.1 hypothetical protein CROST_016260 [Clostridium felsineum]